LSEALGVGQCLAQDNVDVPYRLRR